MIEIAEIVLVAFLAADVLLVMQSRVMHCIRLVAIQGLLLGVLPLLLWDYHVSSVPAELILVSVCNIGLKFLLLPYLLVKTMRSANVCRELEPLVGYCTSLLVSVGVIAGAFFLCRKMGIFEENALSLSVPVALSTIMIGLFIIVSRRKALTQVIGFLVFENGIAVFGSGMMLKNGLAVELGILLDVLVLVFVMGIAVFHISREFEHIDADKLNKLGDWLEMPEENAATEGE